MEKIKKPCTELHLVRKYRAFRYVSTGVTRYSAPEYRVKIKSAFKSMGCVCYLFDLEKVPTIVPTV